MVRRADPARTRAGDVPRGTGVDRGRYVHQVLYLGLLHVRSVPELAVWLETRGLLGVVGGIDAIYDLQGMSPGPWNQMCYARLMRGSTSA